MSKPYFLVYGECVCGWKCACLEGSRWPKCPECDRLVLPPRPKGDLPRYGFVADLMDEQDAVVHVRGFPGDRERIEREVAAERAPLYDPAALAADRPDPVVTCDNPDCSEGSVGTVFGIASYVDLCREHFDEWKNGAWADDLPDWLPRAHPVETG